MTGSYRMSGDGVATTVGALASRSRSAADSAKGAESALSDAVGAVTTPSLAASVSAFADRFRDQASAVGGHIARLGWGIQSIATVIGQADEQMASDTRRLGPR